MTTFETKPWAATKERRERRGKRAKIKWGNMADGANHPRLRASLFNNQQAGTHVFHHVLLRVPRRSLVQSHSAKFTPPNEPRKNLLVFPRSLIRKAVSGNPIGHILRKRRVKMIVTLHPAQVLHETYSRTSFRRGR